MKNRLKFWFCLVKTSAMEFTADNATKLSASLAYYTVFSIGPLLLVIISLTGLFFEQQAVTGKIAGQLTTLLGQQGADSVIDIIENMRREKSAATFSIIGFAVLLFGASTVFVEIQTSINYIWSIRAKPRKGWLKFVRDRLLSFSLIAGLGFLLIVSLFINTLTDVLTERLSRYLGDTNTLLLKGFNTILLFAVITFLFAVIYKVLPDAFISWKDALIGSGFTAIFFLIGKFMIGYYIGNSDIGNTYGAAASVIIVLTWVYYSSIILYFGAEFTKVYCLNSGRGIKPYDTAVFIVKRESKELPDHKGRHPESEKAKIREA